MQKAAYKFARLIITRGWISEDYLEWCSYVIVKQMGLLVFFCITFLSALLLHKMAETAVFVFTVCLLRRRIGGWHASSARQCQILSICLTGANVLLLGPLVERINPNLVFVISEAFSLLFLLIRPVYPAQLHFTAEIVRNNNKKKNVLIGFLMVIQIVSRVASPNISTYFLLGFIAVLIGVEAGIIVQRGGEKSEEA